MNRAGKTLGIDSCFRVGVVGCGAITRQMHLPVLLSLPTVEVVWLCDQDDSKASVLSNACGVRAIPIQDLLADALPPVDGLLLAIPNGARPRYFDLFAAGRQRQFTWKSLLQGHLRNTIA